MTFAVSEGKLLAISTPVYQAPSSVRLSDDYTADYAEVYRRQTEVRTVVDFLARNISQLSLHTFKRMANDDRDRLRDHPLALLLGTPNAYTTASRLVRETISDRGIYDRALWLKGSTELGGRRMLVRIPPSKWRLNELDQNWLAPSGFVVTGSRGAIPVPASDAVYFRGYNPDDTRQGLSPIESLRRVLSEAWAASQMREQVLRNGARISGYIERPASAPAWDDVAFDRFKQGWRAQYSGSGTEAGGTPVLEDGMVFKAASQTAEQLQYVEARKLTREEVAAAYFIPPPMVGLLDHATFSNITEQHKMLYQDTLGPWLKEYCDELGLQLIPDYPDSDSIYVEFNMLEKLRGTPEEQMAALQKSVGRPFVTANEARSRVNMGRIEGGDLLALPVNVTLLDENGELVVAELEPDPAVDPTASDAALDPAADPAAIEA